MDQQRINPYEQNNVYHFKRILAKKKENIPYQRKQHMKNKLSLETDNIYSNDLPSPTSYVPSNKGTDFEKRYQTVERTHGVGGASVRTPKNNFVPGSEAMHQTIDHRDSRSSKEKFIE